MASWIPAAVLVSALAAIGCAVVVAHKRAARKADFLDAAKRGDTARIEKHMAQGMSVNVKDSSGNTALHYAYYHGQKEAIERLIAFGADVEVHNKEGDKPLDMERIASAETLVAAGARLLNDSGVWTDIARGREIYTALSSNTPTGIVIKALVRVVLKNENRLEVLFMAVKLGIGGSEERLNDILDAYGDKSMAEDYLNCGSEALRKGAQRWAHARGYVIHSGTGSHRVVWGKF